MSIPLSRPNPARLSESVHRLREMEQRAIFSNFGPLNTAFERRIASQLFLGQGECLTICNATIGLMIAIRQAMESRPGSRRRYVLMPSFTFAAAAQAAQWNRLTPLFCDIDPFTWAADPASEAALIRRYRDQIAVVVPYATFGYDIDLAHYEDIQRIDDIPVVIDAAASLGTVSRNGGNFGTGFSPAVIFSMHATKSFSTGEGGLIYSASSSLIQTLRSMSNFGFGSPRHATSMGLNGKMSEVSALLATLTLENFDEVSRRRSQIVDLYRSELTELTFQPPPRARQAHQFTPVLLPAALAPSREIIQYHMLQRGIATATYFSPHIAQQTYFRPRSVPPALPVTDEIAARVLTLPLFDAMTDDEVCEVVAALKAAMTLVRRQHTSRPAVPHASAHHLSA